MKIITILSILYLSSAFAGGTPADIYVSVGAEPTCDFNNIQDAIDSQPVKPIHVVSETFNESLSITDQSLELVGGFYNCHNAEFNIGGTGAKTTIDPTLGYSLFISADPFEPQQTVKITGFEFINGVSNVLYAGGGITAFGHVDLDIYNSRLADNTGIFGGAMQISNGAKVMIKNTMVENNSAYAGGGIYCNNCELTVDQGSGLYNNLALGDELTDTEGNGGGIYLDNNSQLLLLTGSKTPELDHLGIHSNQAAFHGGGIYINSSAMFIYGESYFSLGDDINPASISNNFAGDAGGGIFAEFNVVINATSVDISHNTAGVSGAGIEILYNSELIIHADDLYVKESCWNQDKNKCNRFIGNNILSGGAGGTYGGAIKSAVTDIDIENVWFQNNSSGGNDGRGAVLFSEGDDVKLKNVVAFNNGDESGSDGSIFDYFFSDVDMSFMTIIDHDVNEGIVRLKDSNSETFSIINSIIHNNNDDNIMTILGNDSFYSFNCLIVHEQISFAGLGSAININQVEPQFMNRAGGNFNLFSASVNAVDQCANNSMLPSFDMNLYQRKVDVSGMGEEGEANPFIYDIGAIEYQGDDEVLDLIFADSFEGVF